MAQFVPLPKLKLAASTIFGLLSKAKLPTAGQKKPSKGTKENCLQTFDENSKVSKLSK